MIIPLTEGDKRFYTYPELVVKFPDLWVILAPGERFPEIGGVLQGAADDIKEAVTLGSKCADEGGEDKVYLIGTFDGVDCDNFIKWGTSRRGNFFDRSAREAIDASFQQLDEDDPMFWMLAKERGYEAGDVGLGWADPDSADRCRYEREIRDAQLASGNWVVLKKLDAHINLCEEVDAYFQEPDDSDSLLGRMADEFGYEEDSDFSIGGYRYEMEIRHAIECRDAIKKMRADEKLDVLSELVGIAGLDDVKAWEVDWAGQQAEKTIDALGLDLYLSRLQVDDVLNTLRTDLQEVLFRLDACESILRKHGLFQGTERMRRLKVWEEIYYRKGRLL